MDKLIKILVVSDYNKRVSSRPEAEMFIKLANDPRFRISVMTYPGSYYYGKFRDAGIEVIDFHPDKKLDKKEVEFIRNDIMKKGYDIIHLFNGKAIINGLKAARGLKVKVVLYRGYTGNIHWYDPAAYLKVLSPRVDKVMCNSQSVKDQIDRQLFFDKTKTVVITKGHDHQWYSDIKPADLAEFGIGQDEFVVTTTADGRKMKGTEYLLRAFELMPPGLNIRLLIMGGGEEFIRKFSGRIKKNANKVIFTGFRQDNLDIMSSCDVFISPSIKGESFQKSVAEAMNLGVCPVITDIPGNEGMVIDKKCGLIIPSRDAVAIKDALLDLYSDRARCREFATAAKKHISENFSLDKTVDTLAGFYQSLV
ncbi:MAG: glycosyltransferase family 4 protein [Bacteroidales bacterium]|nr:glycosyltransferase family 4 protein [Bacteroidales bacterium]